MSSVSFSFCINKTRVYTDSQKFGHTGTKFVSHGLKNLLIWKFKSIVHPKLKVCLYIPAGHSKPACIYFSNEHKKAELFEGVLHSYGWWYTGQLFQQCCRQQATRWDTGPTTNLKYPDKNLLTILNGKVPKQRCSKKFAWQNCSKSCPVYHQLHSS